MEVTIQQAVSSPPSEYEIETPKFWLEKTWKGVYLCEGGEEQFQLYRHKGLEYSLFQGDGECRSRRTAVRSNVGAELISRTHNQD